MNSTNRLASIVCLPLLLLGPAIVNADDKPRVVITQTDEDAIRKLLAEFLRHTKKVAHRSDVAPYLDCTAHADLVKQGWKAVPYLIDQAARQQSVEAVVGAAIIKDPKVSTPEQVAEWNRARENRIAGDTLPPFLLVTVLRELPPAKDDPTVGAPDREPGARFVGIRPSDAFAWLPWWGVNRGRFEFKTDKPLEIPGPEKDVDYRAGVTARAKAGLLDIHAVGQKLRDILKRGATELGLEVELGNEHIMNVTTSARMKGVTFEEFVYLLGHEACAGGFHVERIGTTWKIGKQ